MADRVDQTGTGANPKVRGLTCNNYRNVSLIYHASRVLLHIILNRLRQYSERQLPEEQTGFRAGRGTRDALFIMQVIIEKLIDLENKELYLIDAIQHTLKLQFAVVTHKSRMLHGHHHDRHQILRRDHRQIHHDHHHLGHHLHDLLGNLHACLPIQSTHTL